MAHLTIRRNKKNAIPFNESLKSGFIIEYARAWRRERAGYVAVLAIFSSLALLGFTIDAVITFCRGVYVVSSGSIFSNKGLLHVSSEVLVIFLILGFTLYAVNLLSVKLPHYANAAFELILLSPADHLIFRHVSIEDEYPLYMQSPIMNITNHSYNLLVVNDYMETRLNWLSVNACPKADKELYSNYVRDAKGFRTTQKLSISKEVTAGFGCGIYILSATISFAVVALVDLLIQSDAKVLGLLAVTLALFLTQQRYFISYLSYKAAFIKLLSDSWPWETDKLSYDAAKTHI